MNEDKTFVKIKMFFNKSGSPDGINVIYYKKDQKYIIPERLAKTFIKLKIAEEIKEIKPKEIDEDYDPDLNLKLNKNVEPHYQKKIMGEKGKRNKE